jgi:glycosyltransferase A (GT-A) superfamily protein (DUF2064 family)
MRAVLLIARSPHREAAAKGLSPRFAALFRRVTAAWIRAAAAASARVVIACEESDRAELDGIAPEVERLVLPQRGERFGERVANAAGDAFALGCTSLVIGAIDAPPPDLARVFASLDEHEVVVAPARDGGVNLIGLRAPAAELLSAIELRRPCIDAFAAAHVLEVVTDVDSARDLVRASRERAWWPFLRTEPSRTAVRSRIATRNTPTASDRAPPATERRGRDARAPHSGGEAAKTRSHAVPER